MEITTIVTNLIKALQGQGYSFEDTLNAHAFVENLNYQSGMKRVTSNLLNSFNQKFISYDNINRSSFVKDYKSFQQNVDDRMLFTWAYKSAALSIVGIIHADDLSHNELKNIFAKLDDGVTNIMRKYVGQVNGQDYGTYGTMLLIFSDSNKAKNFNASIRDYYSSHSFKSTYVSTITIDCSSEVLTQGKATVFFSKWQGGMDISDLKRRIF